MKKTCIFDLDGTLTDSLHSIAYYANAEIAKHGMPAVPAEDFKLYAGNGARVLIQRVLARYGKNDKTLEDEVLKNYNAAYDANSLYLCTVYDGIFSLLEKLKEKNVSVNVLSNKPQPTAEKVVRTLFGEDTFAYIFGAKENVPLKPDPCGVFKILDLLHLEKSEGLYIGDTATDVKTGKAAGLFTVGVLWGFRTKEELEKAGADAIAEHPADILNFL